MSSYEYNYLCYFLYVIYIYIYVGTCEISIAESNTSHITHKPVLLCKICIYVHNRMQPLQFQCNFLTKVPLTFYLTAENNIRDKSVLTFINQKQYTVSIVHLQ